MFPTNFVKKNFGIIDFQGYRMHMFLLILIPMLKVGYFWSYVRDHRVSQLTELETNFTHDVWLSLAQENFTDRRN